MEYLDKTFNGKQAAEKLKCSYFTLLRMIRENSIPIGVYYKLGRRIYFLESKLNQWIWNGGTNSNI